MIKRIEIGISGHSFIPSSFNWVENLATQLKIEGALSMKSDGGVRIIGEGEEDILIKFANKIEKGRIFFRVENFFIKWEEPSKKNFYILAGC